jgi:hypothetical protein
MKSKSVRAAVISLVLAVVALAAYWYWSPYLAMRNMAAAAEAKDSERFNDYVDYARLRESVKGQFSAKMTKEMAPLAADNPFASLGVMMGGAMVNQMVDMMVRPEFVMKAMRDRKPQDLAKPSINSGESTTSSAPNHAPKWEFDRYGTDKILAYPIDPDKPTATKQERAAAVFERSGFAKWKLTELRLPDNF